MKPRSKRSFFCWKVLGKACLNSGFCIEKPECLCLQLPCQLILLWMETWMWLKSGRGWCVVQAVISAQIATENSWWFPYHAPMFQFCLCVFHEMEILQILSGFGTLSATTHLPMPKQTGHLRGRLATNAGSWKHRNPRILNFTTATINRLPG